jgi:hypothetical protein
MNMYREDTPKKEERVVGNQDLKSNDSVQEKTVAVFRKSLGFQTRMGLHTYT